MSKKIQSLLKRTIIISIYIVLITTTVTLLSACVSNTDVYHNTQSGKVETIIMGASKTVVKDKIINQMLNKGYSVKKSDDVSIIFEKPVDNFAASVFFGSRYNITPNARITYTLMQDGKSTRVIADLTIITNPNSNFERATNMNRNPDTKKYQTMLDDIKTSFEKK